MSVPANVAVFAGHDLLSSPLQLQRSFNSFESIERQSTGGRQIASSPCRPLRIPPVELDRAVRGVLDAASPDGARASDPDIDSLRIARAMEALVRAINYSRSALASHAKIDTSNSATRGVTRYRARPPGARAARPRAQKTVNSSNEPYRSAQCISGGVTSRCVHTPSQRT